MNVRNDVVNEIIAVEAGYVNDPLDSGGETNYGITVAVARNFGYDGDMRAMPVSIAKDIYIHKYWDAVNGDELARVCEAVAREIVDTGVNIGPRKAGVILQRSLNNMNDRQNHYADIHVDGNIGPLTISALTSLIDLRGSVIFVRVLNCLQGYYYFELAERREKDERFLYGWFNKRVKF